MNTIVNVRKLDFPDIVVEGVKIFSFKFKELSLLAFIASVPTTFAMVVIAQEFLIKDTMTNGARGLVLILELLVQLIVVMIASMSSAVITERAIQNQAISIAEAVRYAASKWKQAITTGLLVSAIVFGLTLLFVIPGIMYGTYYIFVFLAVTLRDKSGKEALDYSKALVAGQWWRVFGILLGIEMIFVIFNGIVTYPLNNASDNPYFAIVPTVISLFLSMIFGVMNVVLFLNNDFVYHQRLARRKEIAREREIQKPPTIEEYLATRRKEEIKTVRLSRSKKVVRNTENKTAKKPRRVKKSAVKKDTATKKTTITTPRKKAL